MKGINDFRRWVATAPPDTMVSTDALAEMLDVFDMEPAPEPARDTAPRLPLDVPALDR